MKPILTISKTGRCVLRIDAGELASILQDAATGETHYPPHLRPNQDTVTALAAALAEYFRLWQDDASEVYIEDDIRKIYSTRLDTESE